MAAPDSKSSMSHNNNSQVSDKPWEQKNYIIFNLDDMNIALSVKNILKVIPMLEITYLPGFPEIVTGVINLHGEIIPVINFRSRFNLPKRELNLSDQIIIANTSKQKLAFIVDQIISIRAINTKQITKTQDILLGDERYIKGILKTEDNLLLIHDIDSFLSVKEKGNIETALKSPQNN